MKYNELINEAANPAQQAAIAINMKKHHKKPKHESTVTEADKTDTVTMDVPLLIRIMEYAREDAKTDMDLHNVAEKLIQLSKSHDYLCMDNYNEIVGGEHNVSEDSVSIKSRIAKYSAKIKELRDTIKELDSRDAVGGRVGHEIVSDNQYRKRVMEKIKHLSREREKLQDQLYSEPVSETEVWDKPNPKSKHSKLSPAKKSAAKARAKAAGRPYPNMVDNIWAAKKK